MTTTNKQKTTKKEELDFDVVKEDWNRYKLEDGTLIKIRPVLAKFFKFGQEEGEVAGNPVIAVICPPELKGQPSRRKLSPDLIKPEDIANEDVDFEVVREDWAIYRLDDGTWFRLKLTPTKVTKTKFYDARGDPYYIVSWSPIGVIFKPKKREKEFWEKVLRH